MVPFIVILAVLLVLSWAYILFGTKPGSSKQPDGKPRASAQAETRASEPSPDLAADLDRAKKELSQQRTQIQELKGEVKQAKRKLYEAKEAAKSEHDLAKARAEEERGAAAQLESLRAELAHAESELSKMRTEAELAKGRGKSAPPKAPETPAAPAPAPSEPVPAKVAPPTAKAEPAAPRELNRAEREKLERFEHLAHKERGRAVELERESKRLRARVETQNRVFLVTKGELELLREKYKALEKRLNRNLLEQDLLKRALAAVDPSGNARTELTEKEIADSDREVESRLAAEADRPPIVHVRRAPKDAGDDAGEVAEAMPEASEISAETAPTNGSEAVPEETPAEALRSA